MLCIQKEVIVIMYLTQSKKTYIKIIFIYFIVSIILRLLADVYGSYVQVSYPDSIRYMYLYPLLGGAFIYFIKFSISGDDAIPAYDKYYHIGIIALTLRSLYLGICQTFQLSNLLDLGFILISVIFITLAFAGMLTKRKMNIST